MKILTTNGLTELITKIKSSFIKTTDVEEVESIDIVTASTVSIDSTPTSVSTNLITSGGVYTGLAGKQDLLTSIAGYDATKTQTLKNVTGTLTWVDD